MSNDIATAAIATAWLLGVFVVLFYVALAVLVARARFADRKSARDADPDLLYVPDRWSHVSQHGRPR